MRIELGALIALYVYMCFASPCAKMRNRRYTTVPELIWGLRIVGGVRSTIINVYNRVHRIGPKGVRQL